MATFLNERLGIIMDDLELIKQKINIVDLIQEYLLLKKAGINFKANCPFHQEKTPSFMVSPERQIFKCFGCQKGGDIFKFLMEKEGMDFKEALEYLAKKAGIVLKRKPQEKNLKDRLFEVNLKAQEFFHYLLTQHSLGKKALAYVKKRGLSETSIAEFGLGYAPRSWESLTKFLLKRRFLTTEIIESGLGVASKQSSYDRFRGRIVFPLIDPTGRIIGFSGRVLDEGEPKYINTPQTVIFDKGSFLYGLNLAKGEIKQKGEAILVEGEMDVILSHQAGVKNTIAAKGTALTQNQVALLKKYTDNILLCFDMDLAGDSASRRGIEIADASGLNIKVIQMKEGKDPAEVAVKDIKLWWELIKSAIPIYDYYLDSSSHRHNIKDPAGLKKISSELIPIWAKISDDLVRDMYIHKLAALVKTEETLIRKLVDRQRQSLSRPPNYTQVLRESPRDDVAMGARKREELLEEYLIVLLLHIPKDHIFVPAFPETLLMAENLRQIYVLLVLYLDSISFKGRSFDINEFVRDIPDTLLQEVDRLYLTDLDHRLSERERWQKEVEGVIAELKKLLIKASLERLSLEIKNAEEFGKMEILEGLNRRFRDLSVKLKNL